MSSRQRLRHTAWCSRAAATAASAVTTAASAAVMVAHASSETVTEIIAEMSALSIAAKLDREAGVRREREREVAEAAGAAAKRPRSGL